MPVKLRARIALVLRLVLAAVFLYAGLAKLLQPRDLAVDIANYRVLPASFVAPLAVALPGIEIACGVCLFLGRTARAAGLLATVMMTAFTVAVGQALWRGINLECGCFGDSRELVTLGTFFRDLGLSLMAGGVVFLSKPTVAPAATPALANAPAKTDATSPQT